jgi:hypothetical protein
MDSRLETGFELDRLWHVARGEMDTSKRSDLILLAHVLEESQTAYALIGGLALQVHQAEPRTTLDIDIAVLDRQSIPRERLLAGGFVPAGTHPYTENWRGPGGTPVQFSDDPSFAEAIHRATPVALGEVSLRVIAVEDLLRAKLRAAAEPQRRPSKKLRDLADVQELLEEHAGLEAELTDAERALLHALLHPR